MTHDHRVTRDWIARWIGPALGLMMGVMIIASPVKVLHAQDSCAAVEMTVSPCLSGEIHVSYSSTATFSGFNYGYIDDTFYAPAVCTGVVSTCSTTGGGVITSSVRGTR